MLFRMVESTYMLIFIMFQPMVMEIYLFFVTVLISDLYFLIVLIRKTY